MRASACARRTRMPPDCAVSSRRYEIRSGPAGWEWVSCSESGVWTGELLIGYCHSTPRIPDGAHRGGAAVASAARASQSSCALSHLVPGDDVIAGGDQIVVREFDAGALQLLLEGLELAVDDRRLRSDRLHGPTGDPERLLDRSASEETEMAGTGDPDVRVVEAAMQ